MKRLIYSLLILVLIATIGSGWVLDGIYREYIQRQNPIASLASEKDPLISVSDGISVLNALGEDFSRFLEGQSNRQQLLDDWRSNNFVHFSLEPLQDYPLPREFKEKISSGEPLVLEKNHGVSLYFYLESHDELLILDAPSIVNEKNKLLNLLFTITFYALLISLMLLWAYPLIRQLIRLQYAANKFGEGDLYSRVVISRFSYIKDIELSFNRMAKQIETQVNDIKLLSSAVSHDLRTPLARIRFGLDTLCEEQDLHLREKYQQKISDNIDEMVSLVDVLLKYTRMDQNLSKVNFSIVNVVELLQSCIDKEHQVTINMASSQEAVTLYGVHTYLTMLINNLINNAIKYGDNKINIYLDVMDDYLELRVEDNGSGIPKEFREDAVKPFIRGKHNKQGIQGYGFGLAIVKRIVDWHQGGFFIGESEVLGGASMKVILPLLQD